MPSVRARRGPQRARGAITREEIVAASLHLFARRGFHGASIDDVAAAISVTKGSIYWHFDGKEALFEAVIGRIRDIWLAVIAKPYDQVSAEGRLSELFDRYKRLLMHEPDVCLFLQRVLLDADPVFAPRANRVYESTAEFTARVIRQGIGEGVFVADVDPRLVGREMLGAFAGVHAQCVANPQLSLARFVDQIKEGMLRRLLKPKRSR